MRTLVSDPPPPEFEELLERRRRLGLDLFDEVWDGVLHMNPAPHGRHAHVEWQLAAIIGPLASERDLRALGQFNLGQAGDYRVPDGGLQRAGPDRLYYSTAALVIEVVSPGDETWNKLDFYAAHGVDELLIVDPERRSVDWLARRDGEYHPVEESGLIDLGTASLAARIDWPALSDED